MTLSQTVLAQHYLMSQDDVNECIILTIRLIDDKIEMEIELKE